MKRILLTLLIVCFATFAYAGDSAISSGEQAADALIFDGSALITALQVVTDGTNDGKLIVYDNTSAAGTVINEFTVTGASHYGGRVFIPPIEAQTGIYCDISGTGATYFVEYARD